MSIFNFSSVNLGADIESPKSITIKSNKWHLGIGDIGNILRSDYRSKLSRRKNEFTTPY